MLRNRAVFGLRIGLALFVVLRGRTGRGDVLIAADIPQDMIGAALLSVGIEQKKDDEGQESGGEFRGNTRQDV